MDCVSRRAEKSLPSIDADTAGRPAPLERTPSDRLPESDGGEPSANDQSRLFDLLGRIDHRVLAGKPLYIQARGMVYKVLYGVYWRSIYSGTQYWGLRCEEVADGVWMDGPLPAAKVDMPICYTSEGWVVEDQSLKFLLYRESGR